MIYKNGKRLIVLFLLTVMISRFSVCLYSADTKVDMKKVERFTGCTAHIFAVSPNNLEKGDIVFRDFA